MSSPHGQFALTRRRALIGIGAALVSCKEGAPRNAPKEGQIPVPGPAQAKTSMPRRPLGRTGLTVSLVGIGGYHLGLAKSDAEANRIVHMALDHGVDFLDNCWDYHDGKSEERMGQALRGGYRNKAFLMTKLDGRTKEKANEQLEQSLRRLGTDRIDLVQVHEVIRMSDSTGSSSVFAPGGAIEALVAAQKAGKIRYLGFTGHKDPAIHLAMIKAADTHGFQFDTVQMPLNVLDAHYRSFEKEVVPVAIGKGMAVLGMKSMGAGKILETKKVSAIECLHYAMNLPVSVVITGCDSVGVLEQAIHAALTFEPLKPEEVASLLDRTKDVAADGKFETFKTTQEHDGTSKHPEWLGTSAS
jgi:aryl-alcohol dehydrogenase-like predicted oxidoreductase